MKSQKFLKIVCLALALVMCLGIFAACKTDETTDPTASESPSTSSGDTPLVVAYSPFSGKFSPFYGETAYDMDVSEMTQLTVLTTDRNGDIIWDAINGQTVNYGGTDYTYTGPASVVETKLYENEEDTEEVTGVTYSITIRDDLKFSDGVDVTIDDFIFYLYVILDPQYDGPSTLSSQSIVGYLSYRYNDTNVDNISSTDISEAIANIDEIEVLQNYVIDEIIKPILAEEYEWVQTLYEKEAYATLCEKYPVAKDLLYYYYSLERDDDDMPVTDTTELSLEEILDLLYEEYGYNYVALGDNYGANFASQLIDPAYDYVLSTMTGGEEVPNIEGIKKTGEYSVDITIDGYSANAVYQVCGGNIVPMHYYGDESLYDYDNNKFGFESRVEGSLDGVIAKTANPMGAGPYKFVQYKDKIVYFEASEYYYEGEPKTKYMQWKETSTSDLITAVATGTVDIANPDGNLESMQEIISHNTDTDEINGNTITTSLVKNLGYGYIGINARLVNVGGEYNSDASRYLRTGLATILAVYRQISYDSWYGAAASVIEYPISSTSWAAPLPSDQGYESAFSKDINGDDIYTSDMTADEKYAAALEAAVEYLIEAGYTYDDTTGKFTDAPSGAKLTYELTIPGDGVGDHPTNTLVDMAASALESIGITLKKNDCNSALLWEKFDGDTQELWAAAWGSTIDPDMYQVYHSDNRNTAYGGKTNSSTSNHYNINDEALDELIMAARTSEDKEYRKTTYKECLDIIMDWAVEVPCYQRNNVMIFSSVRVNVDTVTPDITPYWKWYSGIDKLELNG